MKITVKWATCKMLHQLILGFGLKMYSVADVQPLLLFLVHKLAHAMTKSADNKENGTTKTNQLNKDFTVLYIDTKCSFIKDLLPKGPRYWNMEHFSRPRYIIPNNSRKCDKYFLNKYIIYNTCFQRNDIVHDY